MQRFLHAPRQQKQVSLIAKLELWLIYVTANDIRKRRLCKAGAGYKEHLGKCDTPGFPLLDEPVIKFDHRWIQKLFMPRNHRRVNQTLMDMLQSWRGNCDIQILVYNCDINNPDIGEIAKVTDYVVSYACKGNTTVKEERKQNKRIIMA